MPPNQEETRALVLGEAEDGFRALLLDLGLPGRVSFYCRKVWNEAEPADKIWGWGILSIGLHDRGQSRDNVTYSLGMMIQWLESEQL